MEEIRLVPLTADDREQFISDNQEAFLYGATEEFGCRNESFNEDGEIISRRTIENSIDGENAQAYRIMQGDKKAGGAVVSVKGERGELELLFVIPSEHSKGIGYKAWHIIERLNPEVRVWETFTPYFEKRNIHFYINRCGFHAVEFFNMHHKGHFPNEDENGCSEGSDEMLRFEKYMK